MSGQFIAFFLLSLFIFAGAIFMISFKKVVHMLVTISFTFLSIAGLYVLLEAEFIAIVQVLIYTGAISILAVFGIMLTRQDDQADEKPRKAHNVTVGVAVVLFLGFLVWTINSVPWGDHVNKFEGNTVTEMGHLLFNQYTIPMELTAVLLLVALLGAIVLARGEGEKE